MSVKRGNPDQYADNAKIADLENLLLERSEELRDSEKRCAALGEQLAEATENARRLADEYEAITDSDGIPKQPKPGFYILMIVGVEMARTWLYIWLKSNRDAEPLFPDTVAFVIMCAFACAWIEAQWKSSERWLLLMRVPLLLIGFWPLAVFAVSAYLHKEIGDRVAWLITAFFSLILLLVQSPLSRWIVDGFKRFMRNPIQTAKALFGGK